MVGTSTHWLLIRIGGFYISMMPKESTNINALNTHAPPRSHVYLNHRVISGSSLGKEKTDPSDSTPAEIGQQIEGVQFQPNAERLASRTQSQRMDVAQCTPICKSVVRFDGDPP
jgi:hypothetical protein